MLTTFVRHFTFSKRHPFSIRLNTEWSKSLCVPDFISGVRWKTQCIQTIPTQFMIWRWPPQNTFGMWTVLYWTRSSRTQFGVSINVWSLVGNTLNITCNFLYCNHHVHILLITFIWKCIMEFDTVQSNRDVLTFQRNLLIISTPYMADIAVYYSHEQIHVYAVTTVTPAV
jgi:hypothetical protein